MLLIPIRLVFIVLISLIQYRGIGQEEYIQWSTETPLEWENFKGEIVYRDNILATAETSYKIEISPLEVQVDEDDNIQNYRELTVKTLFFPTKSWVYDRSDILLNHERLHFDIAELFARKMRREFTKLKDAENAQMQAYQDVWNTLWKACKTMQKKYDRDTTHGTKEGAQLAWSMRIKAQLEVYTIYALKL